jgi:formamidopyrimidine-DNA glycosylase
MPELPEVETIKKGLIRLIVGKTVKRVDIMSPKSFQGSQTDIQSFLIGQTIIGISRKGKVILIELNSDYVLLAHMKMTGQLVFVSDHRRFGGGHPSHSLIGELPDNTTRVAIEFTDGSWLYFNDLRKFGWLKLIPNAALSQLEYFQKLGPELLDPDFDWQRLKTRLSRRPKTAVKPALMDQSVVAGIGNIYADESLWGAMVHPARIVSTLSDTNYRELYRSIIEILKLSLAKGGSTDRNYVDAEGNKGSYLDFASVFRRQGQPCPRCGTTIVKIRLAGRGTHYCPTCQKLAPPK